jgi:glutamine amidotransferase
MCRHLAYHALVRQSWAPRDMRGGGTINADGFGIGWYPPGGGDPVRYRRAGPLWSDTTLPGLAASTAAGAALAAVRSATTGMPVVETAAAPFGEDGWLFSHNGVVAGWPASVAGLAARLPVTDLLTLPAPTDAALLWALVRARLRAGDPPGTALAGTVADVAAAAPGSRLNLLLTDGSTVAATTYGHALSVRADGRSVLISSEPLDDDSGWAPVPDRSLLTATAHDLARTPLGDA